LEQDFWNMHQKHHICLAVSSNSKDRLPTAMLNPGAAIPPESDTLFIIFALLHTPFLSIQFMF
jgi:hypothetical protein